MQRREKPEGACLSPLPDARGTDPEESQTLGWLPAGQFLHRGGQEPQAKPARSGAIAPSSELLGDGHTSGRGLYPYQGGLPTRTLADFESLGCGG